MFAPKNILITGASSGLGMELAKIYASKGVMLFLTGRNLERLQRVSEECKRLGAIVEYKSIEISDYENLRDWLESICKQYHLDLVIANAGISANTSLTKDAYNQIKKIIDTNLYGVINTITPIIPYMIDQQRGQIVIISSLAGYRGMPSCAAYSLSKGAARMYGEALRGMLKEFNIGVTVVTPGYIKTPMTDVNQFPMPFIISAKSAASIIKSKLVKNPSRIAFPLVMYLLVLLINILPISISDYIYGKLPKKQSME